MLLGDMLGLSIQIMKNMKRNSGILGLKQMAENSSCMQSWRSQQDIHLLRISQ